MFAAKAAPEMGPGESTLIRRLSVHPGFAIVFRDHCGDAEVDLDAGIQWRVRVRDFAGRKE